MLHPLHHARTRPDHPAWILADGSGAMTYGAFGQRIRRAISWLRGLGVRPGDGLCVLAENHPDVFTLYWAAQCCGLYFTPVSAQYGADEVAWVAGDCDARIFVTTARQRARVPDLAARVAALPQRWCLDGGDRADVRRDGDRAAPRFDDLAAALRDAEPAPDPLDAGTLLEGAEMLYSSGTTGRPKGVRTTRPGAPAGTVSDLVRRRLALHGIDAATVYLSLAPLYHSAPLRYNAMVHRSGGTSVVVRKFDAAAALALIERHRVTHSQWVPTMFVRLLRLPAAERARHDLSSHRFAVHAAAPCPVDIKRAMLDWWGPILHEYYSGTEANGQTAIGPEEWLAHPGSVGKAFYGQLHILGDDDAELPPGQTGRVFFSGGNDFEYYKDPAKTAGARSRQGWTTLGDIGHVDADGYLYLTDRAHFMIISGGVNIYPQEVEDVLIGHPAVADCAVFGIPDDEFGEQVKAAVELVPGQVASDALAAELVGWCRDRLAHLKCPRSIDFHAALPRHETGKLYKRVLRDAYLAPGRPGGTAPPPAG